MAKSSLESIVETFGKRNEYSQRLKTQLALMAIKNKQSQQKSNKEALIKKIEQRLNPKNAQMYTPEQQYLRRRALEENPLMTMSVPEEGQEMNGVSFPDSVSRPDDKGVYQMRSPATDPALQAQMLDAKVSEMQAQGKKVHPAILKLLSLQRQSAPEFESREGKAPKFDYKTGKEIGKENEGPSAATRKVLENLSKQLQEGAFESRAQVLEDLEENAAALKVKDVDMDYVRSNVMKHLPKTFSKKDTGFFEGLLSAFGGGAKKPSIDILDDEEASE